MLFFNVSCFCGYKFRCEETSGLWAASFGTNSMVLAKWIHTEDFLVTESWEAVSMLPLLAPKVQAL